MKLKCFFLTVAALLFLFNGCNNDTFFGEEPEVTLKAAKVPVPLKGKICMEYNYDVPLMAVDGTPYGPIPQLFMSGEAWLSGNLTHMGKLREESWMKGISAYLDMDALSQGKVIIVAVYDAVMYAANGDYTEVISNIRVDVTDQENKTITGDWVETGGSGKFEDVIGSGTLSGILPCWNSEGTVEFPNKK
jgi:hypothetical protein